MAARKFSTRSALAFVLPAEQQAPVQSIRKIHDRVYDRWPPHINFFFPFVPEEVVPSVVPRIRDALAHIQPFSTVLDTIGSFSHGKGPLTVWLGPRDIQPFVEVFNALSPLFPDLQNNGRDAFVPHMTLGQVQRGKAFETAAAQFKEIIGSIECVVDSLQILVRDADTAFESLYTVFLGGREPEFHANVANRGRNPAAGNEDDQLMSASASAAADHPSVSVLLKNSSATGPHDFAELLGAVMKAGDSMVKAPAKKEKPLVHFFDDNVKCCRSAIAVDTSGSTSGSILKWSLEAVRQAVNMPDRAPNDARESIMERAISWNSIAELRPLSRMSSGGFTAPATIIPLLQPSVRNLLITTDGEITNLEVESLRKALKNCKVNNVIAFIVGGRSPFERASPKDIEMSVFFPLLEHCISRGGTFMLFFITKEDEEHGPDRKVARFSDDQVRIEARLLIKCTSERCAQFSQFVDPPKTYDNSVTWDDVPIVNLGALSYMLVEDDPEYVKPVVAEEHAMNVPGISTPVDLVKRAAELSNMHGHGARDIFASVGMDQFVCDVLPQLIDEGKICSADLAAYLRDIVQKWQRLNLLRIEKETEDPHLSTLLDSFRVMCEERATNDSPELRERLALVADEMRPLLEMRTTRREYFSGIVRSVSSYILDHLAKITAADSAPDYAELPQVFTLDAVSKRMANRARRANVVAPEKLVAPAQAESEWDMTNAPPVCSECLICMRDHVPGAMLTVDISKEHTNVLALNVSDVGIDDALTTGLWNTVAFPAGNFCVSCAFACAALGQHPMTRQPVAAVIPCVDLSIPVNKKLMRNSLCNTFFAGKDLPSTWLVFYGALEGLKREQRFPDELINAFQNTLLHNIRCNLFPETSPLGKSEVMLDAIHRAVCLGIDRMNPETWLVTLRNRSIPSVAMLATTVLAHDDSDQARKSATCMMRRQFFKTIVTAILNAAKRNPKNLRKMRNAIEHDIFNSVAACPVLGTQRLVSITSSNLLKVLFNTRNYSNMMSGMARVISHFKMTSFDELITPAAFSSFLAYIYEHVTRAQISSSQRKVEDFLVACFKPRSGAGELLSDAFFDGAVETSGGDSAALAAVLDSAPYKKAMKSLENTINCGHHKIPRFALSHLYSPPVSHCGICGRPFLSQEEIRQIRDPRSRKLMLDCLVEKLKTRRAKHFAEVFGTSVDSPLPTSSCSMCSLHESVRFACSLPQFCQLKVPTRELVLAALSHIFDHAEPGFTYSPQMLNSIVLCMCDYLQKRELWYKAGRVPPDGSTLLAIRERIVSEIEGDELSGEDVIVDSGLDPELFQQLTAPIEFDPVSDSVAANTPKAMDID